MNTTSNGSREVTAAGVPCTVISAPGPAARPTVLFSNGLNSWREQARPPGLPENPISPPLVAGLLGAGYDVVVPEIPAHGDRRGPGSETADQIAASLSGEGPDLLDLAVRETPRIIDDLAAQGVIGDVHRVGVIGHSWGGLQSMLRMVGDSRVTCGIALIPIIDPVELDPFRSLRGRTSFSLSTLLARTLGGRPLLLLPGALDEIAPASFVTALVDTLRTTAPDAAAGLGYEVLPGLGHAYDERLLELSLDRLRRWLPTEA